MYIALLQLPYSTRTGIHEIFFSRVLVSPLSLFAGARCLWRLSVHSVLVAFLGFAFSPVKRARAVRIFEMRVRSGS
jgi:hypothetical protein